MNNYFIYLRKSRTDMEAEAMGQGETLARHKKALVELAGRLKINVTKVYEEIVSGDTIAARPVIQQVLSEVEQGEWAGGLVMEVERLARGNTIDQGIIAQTFKYSNTKIITPMKTYNPNNEMDEEYFEFGLFMARRELNTIKRRLISGRQASAKEGKFVGSIPPFGYKRKKLEKEKGWTLEIVPENAEIVELIFKLYTQGELCENGSYKRLGVQAIARYLNKIGVAPIRHDYWQKETIKEIIVNPAYAGKIRWGYSKTVKKMINGSLETSRAVNKDDDYILVNGRHKAIIDEKTFELAQYQISQSPPMPIGYKKDLKNPLAGLIICKLCGRSMVFRRGTNRKPDYIVCHNKECKNVSSPFRVLEEKVLNAIKEWLKEHTLQPPKKDKENRGKLLEIENNIKRLEKQQVTLKAQLNKVFMAYEQDVYSAEVFLERSNAIHEQIEESKISLSKLESTYETLSKTMRNSKEIIPHAEKLIEMYDILKTPKEKNDMLKKVLGKCEYFKEKSAMHRGVAVDDFDLVLFPKIPEIPQKP